MIHGRKRIKVSFLDFPPQLRGKVRGFSQERANHYFIGIDRSQGSRKRRQVLRHELTHIYRNHHRQKRRPVRYLEREANRPCRKTRKAPLHIL